MGFGILYILLGVLFTFIAGFSAQDTGWSFLTIIYAAFAVFDFGAGIKHIQLHRANKDNK